MMYHYKTEKFVIIHVTPRLHLINLFLFFQSLQGALHQLSGGLSLTLWSRMVLPVKKKWRAN